MPPVGEFLIDVRQPPKSRKALNFGGSGVTSITTEVAY
jgi:hypothetical protein